MKGYTFLIKDFIWFISKMANFTILWTITTVPNDRCYSSFVLVFVFWLSNEWKLDYLMFIFNLHFSIPMFKQLFRRLLDLGIVSLVHCIFLLLSVSEPCTSYIITVVGAIIPGLLLNWNDFIILSCNYITAFCVYIFLYF